MKWIDRLPKDIKEKIDENYAKMERRVERFYQSG